VYGSYWNRIVEHWGARRLDEPAPSEIRQLMAYVKTHVVARRNARGGRSAEERLVAALRCLYRRAVDDGLIAEADNPGAESGQAAPSADHPAGAAGHQTGADQ
jgi:integrase/recombinase XerC